MERVMEIRELSVGLAALRVYDPGDFLLDRSWEKLVLISQATQGSNYPSYVCSHSYCTT